MTLDGINDSGEKPVYTSATIDTTPVPCDGCGKNMRRVADGSVCIGWQLQNKVEGEARAFVQEQFGRFELRDYSFCYECWIGAIMDVARTHRRKEQCRQIAGK